MAFYLVFKSKFQGLKFLYNRKTPKLSNLKRKIWQYLPNFVSPIIKYNDKLNAKSFK